MSMLDLLLNAQQHGLIDDEGIQEEVDTFTFEVIILLCFFQSPINKDLTLFAQIFDVQGHDTTGMAMTYTLFLLAENKEAQVCIENFE